MSKWHYVTWHHRLHQKDQPNNLSICHFETDEIKIYILIFRSSMIHHRQEPWSTLESVRTAGFKVQRAETPVFQFTNKVFGTNTFCEVKLPLSIESKDVLKYSWTSVKVELSCCQAEWVTQTKYFIWKQGIFINLNDLGVKLGPNFS